MTDGSDGVAHALRALATEAQSSAQLPGLTVATFVAGEVVWRADLGDVGAQYRIGSITKTFTAVEVMRLRDAGRLELDDAIGKHLPDTPHPEQTIGRLLSHHAGITAEPAGPWWERTSSGTWATLAEGNASPGGGVLPSGVRYHYSNLGYGLLGELVARLRGMSWFDSVRTGLLEPLEMTQTSYSPQAGAAAGTSRDPRSGRLVGEPAHDAGAMAPAGQLWSTTVDLARWADFLAVGHAAIVPLPTLVEMRTARSADPDTQHLHAYGLGLQLHWRARGTLIGHTGSMPGFLAGLLVDPVTRVGAVALTNATTGLRPAQLLPSLIETVEQSAPQAPARPQTPLSAVVELSGEWFWGNSRLLLEPTSDGFTLSEPGSQRRFVAEGPDRFRGVDGYFAGELLVVERGADETVSHLAVVTFVLTREPYDPRAPIPGGPPVDLSSPG